MTLRRPLSDPHGTPRFPAVRPGRPLTAVALLTLAAAGAGCSGTSQSATSTDRGTSAAVATARSTPASDIESSGSTVASASEGTTSTSERFGDEQRAVIVAYERAMSAYQSAASASNPFDPTFKDAFTPNALRELQIRIQQRSSSGQAVRDAQPSRARVAYIAVTVDASSATLTTCEVDDRVVYRTADGSVVNDHVSTARWTVAMTAPDGTWRIDNRQQDRTWDGEEMDACLADQQS